MTISQMLREKGDHLGLEAADTIDLLSVALRSLTRIVESSYQKNEVMPDALRAALDVGLVAVAKAEAGHL